MLPQSGKKLEILDKQKAWLKMLIYFTSVSECRWIRLNFTNFRISTSLRGGDCGRSIENDLCRDKRRLATAYSASNCTSFEDDLSASNYAGTLRE